MRNSISSPWARLLTVTVLTCIAHGIASAHGPTRQKVSVSVDVDASPAAVWSVLGDFQAAHKWLPMVESSSGEGGNEEGATRTLSLVGGAGEVHEVLKRYDGDRMIVSYRIPQATHDVNILPVSNYSSTLSVRASDTGEGSTVTWRGAFYRGYMNNDPPENLSDEAAVAAVKGLYEAGLAGLKETVESQR